MYYKIVSRNNLMIIFKENVCEKNLKDCFSNPKMLTSMGTLFIVNHDLKLEGIMTVGDYKRFLKNGKIRIVTKYKKIIKGEKNLEEAEAIAKLYEHIHMLPLLNHDGILDGAICLKDPQSIADANLQKFYEDVVDSPKMFEHLHGNIRIWGNEAVVMSGLGIFLQNQNPTCTVSYITFDEIAYFRLFKIWGDIVQIYGEVKDSDSLDLLVDSNIVLEGKPFFLDYFGKIKEIKDIENIGKKKALSQICSKKIEKEYGINIKYIGIPSKSDLSGTMRDVRCMALVQEEDLDIFAKDEYWRGKYNELLESQLKIKMIYRAGMIQQAGNSKYNNYINGHRRVPNVLKEYVNTIYIIGPCIVRGSSLITDDQTIGAVLQEYVKRQKYRVVICSGAVHWGNYVKWLGKIKVKQGDYIFFVDLKKDLPTCDLDLTQPFQQLYNKEGQFFYNGPIHCNKIGLHCVAEEIYRAFFMGKEIPADQNSEINRSRWIEEFHDGSVKVFAGNSELELYKKQILAEKTNTIKGKVGAIVMNCNPFTLGHRYLIETALKQVGHLYIFVVQEDKSIFPFQDRFRLVEEGVQDLEHITVLPSGKFIISTDTFSEYFTKGMSEHETIDTSLDVEIFAQHIAPTLDIDIRFVGQEPLDEVTRQYNESMKEILPDYEIEVCEIPRKELEGEVISASRVRSLLEIQDFDRIAEMVPETTLRYLKNLSY